MPPSGSRRARLPTTVSTTCSRHSLPGRKKARPPIASSQPDLRASGPARLKCKDRSALGPYAPSIAAMDQRQRPAASHVNDPAAGADPPWAVPATAGTRPAGSHVLPQGEDGSPSGSARIRCRRCYHGQWLGARWRDPRSDRRYDNRCSVHRAGAIAIGEGSEYCDDCGEDIPPARRRALPGIRTCIECQSKRDRQIRNSGINRRGSKDSQLR